MWERMKNIFGGGGGLAAEEESASGLAAEYYALAQGQAAHDAGTAIRNIAFAAELDDTYRVRAIDDPAFDGLREDTRYRLVVTRRRA